jgi:imidazolonepropionase-like amidohydrolase
MTDPCWRHPVGHKEPLGLTESSPGSSPTLGIVAEGALADLVLVDGDPLADIQLIADPAKNFVVIMKDGKVYKNSLR